MQQLNKLVTAVIHWEIFTLLFDSFVAGEITLPLRDALQGSLIAAACFEVVITILVQEVAIWVEFPFFF